MAARAKKACGAVSLRRHCPDQVLGGRRPASELSPASQPFLPAPGLPGTPFGPAPSITSQTIFTLHGAGDGHLGPKALACTGRTSWLWRKLRQRSGPVPAENRSFLDMINSTAKGQLNVGQAVPCPWAAAASTAARSPAAFVVSIWPGAATTDRPLAASTETRHQKSASSLMAWFPSWLGVASGRCPPLLRPSADDAAVPVGHHHCSSGWMLIRRRAASSGGRTSSRAT
jgi:hypothetical protein